MGLRILSGSQPEVPRNILLTRLSAIGDCVLTLPLAVDIKKLWPQCRLTWVVDCAAAQLLESHPAVDEVLRIEKHWLQKPAEWSNLKATLRERQFDLALDPQGLTKSAMLGWLSGARRRVGFDYSHAREIAPLFATQRVPRKVRHMVDTYRRLLSPWTQVVEGQGEFGMPVYEHAVPSAEQMLADVGLQQGCEAGWYAINPGAGWPTKVWPVQRFGQLARELYRDHGRRSLVFWAGDSELLMAKVIAEESAGAAVVAPNTNLQELTELIRRASLLVSGDTGPLHLASAVGTPSVSLNGPTWADECGPYRTEHVAVQSSFLPHSTKPVRSGPATAMQAIEVGEVLHACRQMFRQAEKQLRTVAA